MAPSPQEFSAHNNEKSRTLDGESVVISGMSGLYPMSKSVKELSDILYNKKNPVSAENLRWKFQHPEVVAYTGKVPQLELFDAQFFKVHYRLSNNMDSMCRKILEQAYQAIYDAGVSPVQLSGKKVGVYVGSCFSETEKACFYVASSRTGFGIAGCSKTMFANRISYWLNAKGPSLSIDVACCSSLAALEQAYLALTRGDCEAAIVGGANLCLHPQSSVHYSRIMQMCVDGKTKSFDENASGCAKSEAINVLFLQKAKDALRVYAEVLHVKSEFVAILEGEIGPTYGFNRDPLVTANFLQKFYSEARVPPSEIEYLEAFGSAVPEADKSELDAIDHVFCKDRNVPLPVGSVMSNIGYSEAASGISAVTKVLLGYETGLLAGNLHLNTPRQDVAAIREGRLDVITDHHRFGRSYVGVNALSITGVNAHVLLHGHYKPKDLNRYKSDIPRLVTLSGRQESAVSKIIEDLKSRPIDPEELALLYNIHETKITGHMGKGYVILDTKDQKTVSLIENVQYCDETNRPLWFVYSGMGSQWPGMGVQLMRIPIFAGAIERCRKVLEPKGIDLLEIIMSRDKSIFDNILHSFVGIAAVQIGLTDILRELGFVPDKIIGHSVGELGCAYADGCLTAEEMISAAYYRGLVSIQTPLIRGSMAAVGVGYQQIKSLCPPSIDVACHNGPQSSTISGPEKEMREFVTELVAKKIFAKEVPCSNIAYHSRYIADAGPGLLKYMNQVIKEPKLRSEKWVSSSVAQDKWKDSSALYCSAEYLTNNLLSPVLFEETSAMIPSNAVLVEIAPHGLLQAILKRSLNPNCLNVALTRRGHPDNAYLVLEAVGRLYLEGFTPKVKVLYPKVEFPVSTGTPMLSHQTEWVHTEKWSLPLYSSAHKLMAAACTFVISLNDDTHQYLRGHVVRGKNMYPFAAALVAVWDTLCMSLHLPKRQTAVKFCDIHFYAQPVTHDQRQLRLSVTLQRGTGQFEVMGENSKVVTGFIISNRITPDDCFSNEPLELTSDDIYQLFNIRDYSYSGEFKSIHSANASLTRALLEWNDNWVTLLDGIFQLNMLRQAYNGVTDLRHIRSISIDNNHQTKFVKTADGKVLIEANTSDTFDETRCGGIKINNIKYHNLPARLNESFALRNLKFIPYFSSNLEADTALHMYIQITAENVNKNVLNIVGITNQKNYLALSEKIQNMDYIPGLAVKYYEINLIHVIKDQDQLPSEIDLVVVENLSIDDKMCQILHTILKCGTFVLNDEIGTEMKNHRPTALYRKVCAAGNLQLLRWRPITLNPIGAAITVRTNSELSILTAARNRLQNGKRMLVFAPYPAPSGLIDLVRRWRRESTSNQVNLVLADSEAVDQHLDTDADLSYNVWKNGVWGGDYYVPWQAKQNTEQRVSLESSIIGDLNSLHWVASPPLIGSGVKVNVHYAGINEIDVSKASGEITYKDSNFVEGYGMDFSGVTERGERVMGLVVNGACNKEVQADPDLLWPVPDHWSLEDAATVPLAYVYAFYCISNSLDAQADYRTGNKYILIHEGTDSVGQAAISVALAFGYEVFTTVSDTEKKRFLLKLFPQLKDKNIGNSGDTSFADMVISSTAGGECGIVISCMKGEMKDISMKCVASRGTIFDLSLLPRRENYMFGMSYLQKERSYVSLNIMDILKHKNIDDIKEIHRLISEGIVKGYVRPLSRLSYPAKDASSAFQLLANGQHRGKVLIRLSDPIAEIEPRLSCYSDCCNLIICDEGLLGLHLAERLICRGTRKLHLHYRNPPPAYLLSKTRAWDNLGIDVKISSQDLNVSDNVFGLINDTKKSGPVEGIYIIAMTSCNNRNYDIILSDLDVASRKLCPTLRYFTLVTSNDSVGLYTFSTRANVNYPALKLSLDYLKMTDENNPEKMNATCMEGIIDVVEKTATNSRLILTAKHTPETKISLVHQVEAVAGVSIQEENAIWTLEQFGIANEKAKRVASFLRNNYSISYNEEYIESMTVKDLKELENILSEVPYKNAKGLETFYTYVDPDELLATAEVVQVSTLTNSKSTRDDEFDVSKLHLCIIPGLEGHYKRFSYLAQSLKINALVLQPGLDKPYETIEQLAERYTQFLLRKGILKNNFYLLGFESGVLIALEVAARLEKQGLQGTVFCIGNDPDEFRLILDQQLSEFGTDEELQDGIIRHMFMLMTGGDTRGLEKALASASAWNDKIDACVRTLLGRVSHSAQYAKGLIKAAFERIKQVKSYKAELRPLRSKIVYLRPASSLPKLSATFTVRSLQPVAVHDLPSPLLQAPNDLRCAAIINRNLHKDILEDYESQSLCEIYLLNGDTFMSIINEI